MGKALKKRCVLRRLRHSYFYGAEHDRVIVLLEEDALIVFDRVSKNGLLEPFID